MEELREGFVHFWEVLTGVFDDDRSKFIRLASFAVLFGGMLWAGYNYFQAERIANLEEEFSDYSFGNTSAHHGDTMDKLSELAETVGMMRRGGENLAASMSGMNVNPFNIAGYDEMGLEDLNTPVGGFDGENAYGETPNTPQEQQHEEEQEQKEELLIKALMLSGRTKYAIIDYAQKEGYVIRQGQELPGGAGRVVRITREGITVRRKGSKEEIVYTVK